MFNKEHLNLSVHKRSKIVKWPEFSNGTGKVFERFVGGFSSYMSQFDTKTYSSFPFNKLQHSLAEHAYFFTAYSKLFFLLHSCLSALCNVSNTGIVRPAFKFRSLHLEMMFRRRKM